MRRGHAVGLLVLMGVLFGGCDWIIDHPICAAEVQPAVEATIVDAGTGAPLADSAQGVLRDGSYVDTMRVYVPADSGASTLLEGGDGRAGTYDVRVQADGFERWTRSGVTVSEGECGVK